MEWNDDRRAYGEQRWITVGLIDGIDAERNEREDYYRNRQVSLDPERPPALSERARKRLAAMAHDEIDFSDIPATHGVDWRQSGTLTPPENKQQITLRVDTDVLKFFKATGRRYQTRMNDVLRSYMNAHAAERSAGSSDEVIKRRQRVSKKRR